MKLYSPKDNYKTQKLLVIAKFANVPVQFMSCDYKTGKEKKFLEKYPNSKLPALEAQGQYLFGCSAIARYIADRQESQLKVACQLQKALIDQWIDYTDYQVDKYASALYLQVFDLVPRNQERFTAARRQLSTCLKTIQHQLRTRTFLTGEKLTVADLCLSSTLVPAFRLVLDVEARQSFPHLTRWFSQISSLPPFQEFFGVILLFNATQG